MSKAVASYEAKRAHVQASDREQARDGVVERFRFDDHDLVVLIDESGVPWFVGRQVCDALGLGRQALDRLDDDEKGARIAGTPGGPQQKATINESGLYSLILRSRKPEAKRFKRWVTHEVLPALRKRGFYAVPGAPARALEVMAAQLAAITSKVESLAAKMESLAVLSLPMSGLRPLAAGQVLMRRGRPIEVHVRSTGPEVFDQVAVAFTAAFPGRHLVLGGFAGTRPFIDWRGTGANYTARVCTGHCTCALTPSSAGVAACMPSQSVAEVQAGLRLSGIVATRWSEVGKGTREAPYVRH